MTTFENFELLYKQFLNLTMEINKIIEEGDYEIASLKINDKNRLIDRLANVENTVNFTAEERQKIDLMNQKISEDNITQLEFLKKLLEETGKELKNTKKKIKINSAYSLTMSEGKEGSILDISE